MATFGSVFREFACETSAHGLKRAVKSQGIIRRVIWIILIVFAVTTIIAHVVMRIGHYAAFPAKTVLNQHRVKTIDFPTVTVCSSIEQRNGASIEIGCSFGGKECPMKINQEGSCVSIPSKKDEAILRQIHPGPSGGLKLNITLKTYLFFQVHAADDSPKMEGNGISVETGNRALARISLTRHEDLPAPFSECDSSTTLAKMNLCLKKCLDENTKGDESCDCQPPCQYDVYETKVSQFSSRDGETILEVFFEDFKFLSMKQEAELTINGMIAGLATLIIVMSGISVLTMFEILEFLIDLCIFGCGKRRGHAEVPVHETELHKPEPEDNATA